MVVRGDVRASARTARFDLSSLAASPQSRLLAGVLLADFERGAPVFSSLVAPSGELLVADPSPPPSPQPQRRQRQRQGGCDTIALPLYATEAGRRELRAACAAAASCAEALETAGVVPPMRVSRARWAHRRAIPLDLSRWAARMGTARGA